MNTEIEIRQKLAKNITALKRQIEEVEQVKVNLERHLVQLRVQLDKKCEELKFQFTCQRQKKASKEEREEKSLRGLFEVMSFDEEVFKKETYLKRKK